MVKTHRSLKVNTEMGERAEMSGDEDEQGECSPGLSKSKEIGGAVAEPLQGLSCLISQRLLNLESSRAHLPPGSQVSEKMENRYYPRKIAAHSWLLAGTGILGPGKDLCKKTAVSRVGGWP